MERNDKPWKLDDAAQARINSELQRIEQIHSRLPRCPACGQAVSNPLPGGFCHRKTDEHDRLKAEIWKR